MDTIARITFVDATDEKPSYTMHPHGQPATRNGVFETKPVLIRDARLLDTPRTLNANGFELVTSDTKLREDTAEKDVPSIVYPEIVALILKATGATDVMIFDHTIRSSDPNDAERGVASHVHVDYTPVSFAEKLRIQGIDSDNSRIVQINAWRPLSEPVFVSPLALADSQTVDQQDLVECDLIYLDRLGEIYEVAWSPAHHWFYYPHMMRNEVLLFKGFDSSSTQEVNVCPHTAFTHPNETSQMPPRRSIEFRAFAIYRENGK